MADPATLATSSMALSGAGTGISIMGALQGGSSQSKMFQYQAGIAEMNRKIDLQNRDYSLTTGETQAKTYGIKAAQQAGAIHAGQGASGIDVGSGSSVDVRESQSLTKDIDLNTIRANAARVAYGYATEAAGDEAKSNLYGMAAKNAEQAGKIKALGSLIGGATNVADKWKQMGQYGLNGSGSSFLNSQPLDI